MKWLELKKFCESLTKEQLENNVVIWREEECISDIGPVVLEEDYYLDEEEGGGLCIPESEFEWDINVPNVKKVYNEGFPLLMAEY